MSVDLDKCYNIVKEAVNRAGETVNGLSCCKIGLHSITQVKGTLTKFHTWMGARSGVKQIPFIYTPTLYRTDNNQLWIIRSKIWSTKSNVSFKSSDIDLVTEVDQEVEKYLITTISSNFPDHAFIGEESVGDGGKCQLTDLPTWIIDPIDGTMNFVHGYPNVCISIALLVKKIPELGMIYNPVLDQFFEARRGEGAKMNGKAIHASNVTELSKALIGYECGTSRDEGKRKNVIDNLAILTKKVHGIRGPGSAAINMAMVALGAADAYFEFGIHAWDVAAGDLIVREAGGVVIDPAGAEFDVLSRRVLCAGTKELALALSQELIQFYPERD